MTTPKNDQTLAELVDFPWWPSVGPMWLPAAAREAYLPLGNPARTSAECHAVLHEEVEEYEADPWLGISEGPRYQPLRDEPALFRHFADLPVSREAYAAFAESYGSLRAIHHLRLPDRLSDWIVEHYRLQRAVAMFDAVSRGSVSDPADYGITFGGVTSAATRLTISDLSAARLSFRGRDAARFWESAESSTEDTNFIVAVLHRALGDDEPGEVMPSDAGNREVVQRVLSSTVTQSHARLNVTPTLVVDGRPYGTGMRLTYKVYDLIGAMWLQLALAIDGNRTYKKCPVCGRWWDATDARSHKQVCSDKCRAKKSYEERQRRMSAAQGSDSDE